MKTESTNKLGEKFVKTVQAMTMKEIILMMVQSLRNPVTDKIDMYTYGTVRLERGKITDTPICYGCAATNMIVTIAGISRDEMVKLFQTSAYEGLSMHTEGQREFVSSFEVAIDNLRNGNMGVYNATARRLGLVQIKVEDFPSRFKVPELDDDFKNKDLVAWENWANTLDY